jgi:hypothetical protein
VILRQRIRRGWRVGVSEALPLAVSIIRSYVAAREIFNGMVRWPQAHWWRDDAVTWVSSNIGCARRWPISHANRRCAPTPKHDEFPRIHHCWRASVSDA